VGLFRTGNVVFKRLLFCLPIPNRVSTSRTSLDALGVEAFFTLDRDRVRVSLSAKSPVKTEDVWSCEVEMDGDPARLGFDMLRPSRASRRSVTPSPLVERTRLCSEIFSICMSAGEIFRRGDMPSERRTQSTPGAFSTTTKINIKVRERRKRYLQSLRAKSGVHFVEIRRMNPS
jgi:hypothetical protein